MRLIDADAYAAEMKVRQDACKKEIDAAIDDEEKYDRLRGQFTVFVEAKLTLDAMPTVDAVPVCHAFWYLDKDGMDRNIGAWRCSACHNRPNTIWETEKNLRPRRWSGSAYCSNCGAVMDGKEDK